MRRLRFSGAGVSSRCGVRAGVNGGVCVGLCEPGSGLPSSESFRLLVRFRVASDSATPEDVDTTVIIDEMTERVVVSSRYLTARSRSAREC